jgi:hypothetical protein
MEKKLKELKKEFAEFIEQIPESLKKTEELIGKELSFEYEYIDLVHQFYEKNFQNPERLDLNIEILNKCFYAYMGEAFMYYNGGNWALCTLISDKAFGTPLILNWGTPPDRRRISISPYMWKEHIVRGLMDEPISKIVWRATIPWRWSV